VLHLDIVPDPHRATEVTKVTQATLKDIPPGSPAEAKPSFQKETRTQVEKNGPQNQPLANVLPPRTEAVKG